LNLLIMWGVLQNLDAALTLPGIAGIVLTVGMAVDANVLVFERIREEFKISNRLASAVAAGYRKAFSAILDSNVTTILAALILIQFDSGPVKGFAVTLIIGICSSMFTALFMTRYFFAGWVRNPKNTELKMSELLGNTNFDFLARWKTVTAASLCVMIVGGYLLLSQWNSILGMDFTGGYAVTVRLEEQADDNYRSRAMTAFNQAGALAGDVEIRELNRPNQLRVQMGFSIEDEGHPFYRMPERVTLEEGQPEYMRNPRLTWVVNTLEGAGLKIKESNLANLDKGWTLMSGQFSEVMRNNALYAIGCALLVILVYLTFRFEFKYAIAAIIALTHDVFVSLSLLGILYWVGVPVQINLEVIGAIMTVIGYSLNDTIIIFDRIREDMRLMKKRPMTEVVNHALNVTLSRTLITSGTTLLVLMALVILGGTAIFDLALVMTLGVFFGTLSSLFIASPVMLLFHHREMQNGEKIDYREKKA
ncbi:MAG: protein translocase subunit SecF, partial [Chlamydiia bacterium]|nr:protein translocase subunit SecF [Chlamydiia bacterium]